MSRTPEELEAFVTKMRALGVAECDGIKLGPLPATPATAPTAQEILERKEIAEERQRDIMFAASHVKPRLRAVKR